MKKNKDYIPYTVTKNDRYANLVGSSFEVGQGYVRYGSHRYSDSPAKMGTMLRSEQQAAKKRGGGYGSYKILDKIEKL